MAALTDGLAAHLAAQNRRAGGPKQTSWRPKTDGLAAQADGLAAQADGLAAQADRLAVRLSYIGADPFGQ